MRLSESKLRKIIRETLLEVKEYDSEHIGHYDGPTFSTQPVQSKPFDLGAVAEETVAQVNASDSIRNTSAEVGSKQRGPREQNRDVFLYGPYRQDFYNQVVSSAAPGDYFKRFYGGHRGWKEVFDLYQKHAAPALELAREQHAEEKFTKDDARKLLTEESWEGLLGDSSYFKTEDFWKKMWKAAEQAGRGTHSTGRAFDLKGFSSKSKSSDIEEIARIANQVAKAYSSEFLPFGQGSVIESDHLHMAYKTASETI